MTELPKGSKGPPDAQGETLWKEGATPLEDMQIHNDLDLRPLSGV